MLRAYVPWVELGDGTRLTEMPTREQSIADQAPPQQPVPAKGSLARCQPPFWPTFVVATKLHKAFGPLFDPATAADDRPAVVERLRARLTWVDQQLAGGHCLMGEPFSATAAQLFTVTG